MLRLPGQKIAIIDLKTARFTAHQDSLAPMYKTQLNGYSVIAESLGMGEVQDIGLVYCEPPSNDVSEGLHDLINSGGFSMPFHATAVPVELERSCITPLLQRAKDLMDMEEAPTGHVRCKDCVLVDRLLLGSTGISVASIRA